MKKSVQTLHLAFLSILFICQHANAQTHKSYISRGNESLPMNRAAFIFCYNNATTYKNPADAVLSKNINHVTVASETNNKRQQSDNSICMFPNLTEDELWVELDNKKIQRGDLQIEIYNANGEIVYNEKIKHNLHKINVCDFISGTFLVKLGDSVQKMIIE